MLKNIAIFCLGALAAITASLLYIGRDGYVMIKNVTLSQSLNLPIDEWTFRHVSLHDIREPENLGWYPSPPKGSIIIHHNFQKIYSFNKNNIAKICKLNADQSWIHKTLYSTVATYWIWLKDDAAIQYKTKVSNLEHNASLQFHTAQGKYLGSHPAHGTKKHPQNFDFELNGEEPQIEYLHMLASTLNNDTSPQVCDA